MDSNGRNMFYRLATDRNTLELAKRDVARLNSGPSLSFNATQVIVVTYDNVNQHRGDSNRYHYQFALVTDGNVTYAVLNYERLDRNGPNGYTEPVGRRCFDITRRFASDVRSMVSTSNVGIPGKHVFLLTANDTGECINRKGIVTFYILHYFISHSFLFYLFCVFIINDEFNSSLFPGWKGGGAGRPLSV